MDMEIMLHRRRSSQRYIVTLIKGSKNIIAEQERVRKCEGLLRTEGREDMYANLIARPILAWFLRPRAEMRVAIMERRAAESTLPGEIR